MYIRETACERLSERKSVCVFSVFETEGARERDSVSKDGKIRYNPSRFKNSLMIVKLFRRGGAKKSRVYPLQTRT